MCCQHYKYQIAGLGWGYILKKLCPTYTIGESVLWGFVFGSKNLLFSAA